MSHARAVCVVSDEASRALLKGFIKRDWDDPQWPAELPMTSEDGREFSMVLNEDAFIHYNGLNRHLQLEALVDGEQKSIIADLLDPNHYQVSFFADLSQLRSKLYIVA